jgi:hypothetical protein
MADEFAAVMDAVAAWLARSHAAGWLSEADLAQFHRLERGGPVDLFTGEIRPLVVAFFGGTGVGKSSLLNRLAREEVARVGVERPTSHEVTLYLHHSVALANLPDALPVDCVRVERHHDDHRRDVVWIDMPDIDSTVTENRDLALAWLPYIDLLIYVVSPERYRDDSGWRVLRARGHRHGWLFVMNRCDEGDPRQLDDFAVELRAAGFSAPRVVATSCAPGGAPAADDHFDALERMIQAVVDAHGIDELDAVGRRARLVDLRQLVVNAGRRLGGTEQWVALRADLARTWCEAREGVVAGLAWPIEECVARIALRHEASRPGFVRGLWCAVRRLRERPRPGDAGTHAPEQTDAEAGSQDLADTLWDGAAQARVGRVVDGLEVAARQAGIAATPLVTRLQPRVDSVADTVAPHLREALGRALARPGTPVQRLALRAARLATGVLPLAALARIAYDVVAGYGRGLAGEAPFLGLDFAIHGLLLVATAWLIPFAFQRLLRPDPRETARRGLRIGLDAGLDDVMREIDAAFDHAAHERDELSATADHLVAEIDSYLTRRTPQPHAALRDLLATGVSADPPAATGDVPS